MCASQQNRKKTLKPLIMKTHVHSRPSILTPLKSLSLVLVIISCISALICKRFYATRVNSSKLTTFRGVPFLTPACAALLQPRGPRLAALKSTFNAENFVCCLSLSISSHFVADHS